MPETTETAVPTIPEEMTDALRNVLIEARELQADLDRIVTTATNWLANTEAYPFPMSGCFTREAADLEIAIAKYDALRSVAYKLTAFEANNA